LVWAECIDVVGTDWKLVYWGKTGTRHIILSCALKIIALRATYFIGRGNDLVMAWLNPIGALTEIQLGFVGVHFEE